MNPKYKSVPIKIDDYEKALFLAMRLNKPISAFLGELIRPVFQVCLSYKTLNLEYEISILSSTVTISAYGQNTFYVGELKDEQEIKKHLGQGQKVVQRAIQKARFKK